MADFGSLAPDLPTDQMPAPDSSVAWLRRYLPQGVGDFLAQREQQALAPVSGREIAGDMLSTAMNVVPAGRSGFAPRSSIPERPIMQFRRDASAIESSLPEVQDGYGRLWRGNRPGELGQNPSFTNSLPGIALPFRKMYGGPLSYLDVPMADLPKYLQTGAVAPGSEFMVPRELAAMAKPVPLQNYLSMPVGSSRFRDGIANGSFGSLAP